MKRADPSKKFFRPYVKKLRNFFMRTLWFSPTLVTWFLVRYLLIYNYSLVHGGGFASPPGCKLQICLTYRNTCTSINGEVKPSEESNLPPLESILILHPQEANLPPKTHFFGGQYIFLKTVEIIVIQNSITFSKFSPWVFLSKVSTLSYQPSKAKIPKAVFSTFDFITIYLRTLLHRSHIYEP
jgi:hypothetical protein